MTNKTTEALKLAGKALGCSQQHLDLYHPEWVITRQQNDKALAAIREALAEPVQEPVMDYERLTALREGEQNRAENDYFNARPHNDTPTLRGMFCQGFDRGFNKGLKYAAPVSAEAIRAEALEQAEEIAKTIGGSFAVEFLAAIRGLK